MSRGLGDVYKRQLLYSARKKSSNAASSPSFMDFANKAFCFITPRIFDPHRQKYTFSLNKKHLSIPKLSSITRNLCPDALKHRSTLLSMGPRLRLTFVFHRLGEIVTFTENYMITSILAMVSRKGRQKKTNIIY